VILPGPIRVCQEVGNTAPTWALALERVTGIEPALSAWESDRSWPMKPLTSQTGRPGVAVIDRSSPWLIAR
jgi:hypothetical protein